MEKEIKPKTVHIFTSPNAIIFTEGKDDIERINIIPSAYYCGNIRIIYTNGSTATYYGVPFSIIQ